MPFAIPIVPPEHGTMVYVTGYDPEAMGAETSLGVFQEIFGL